MGSNYCHLLSSWRYQFKQHQACNLRQDDVDNAVVDFIMAESYENDRRFILAIILIPILCRKDLDFMNEQKRIEARHFLVEEVRKIIDQNVRPEQPVLMNSALNYSGC